MDHRAKRRPGGPVRGRSRPAPASSSSFTSWLVAGISVFAVVVAGTVYVARQNARDAAELTESQAHTERLEAARTYDYSRLEGVSLASANDGARGTSYATGHVKGDTKVATSSTRVDEKTTGRATSSTTKRTSSKKSAEAGPPSKLLADGSYNPDFDHLADPLNNARLDTESPAAPKRAGKLKTGFTTAEARATNRVVALVLSGQVGSERLEPNDPQTWGRLQYFFQQETAEPCLLVPAASLETYLNSSQSNVEVYRLVVSATAGHAGGITFYGQTMGSKYRCQLQCRLERFENGKALLVDTFGVTESMTPAKAQSSAKDARTVYDLGVEKLARALGSLRNFRRRPT